MIHISSNKVNLNSVKNNYKRVISQLPLKLGATAVQYVHDNFRQQGFVDEGLQRWKPRQDKSDQGRAILVGKGSGRLRRDIRVIRSTQRYVAVGSRLPYAKIHNEGGTINHPGGTSFYIKDGEIKFVSRVTAAKRKGGFPKTKPHRISMPARPFLPTARHPSRKLNKMLVKLIQNEMKKVN